MNIGIDARMYGLEHAGIGRYVKNLVNQLLISEPNIHFTLFLHPKHAQTIQDSANLTKVISEIRHYTLKEQTSFLKLLQQHPQDLMHFPHFNVPLFFNRPFVVTIHDILWHHHKGTKVTTLSPVRYKIKYQGYKLVVQHAITHAKHVIVPSQWVKEQLLAEFKKVNSESISVTYEGVDDDLSQAKEDNTIFKKLKLTKPYFIYVGNAYPHKNLNRLVLAFKTINQTINQSTDQKTLPYQPIKLVIVGSRDVFVSELKQFVAKEGLQDQVLFAGFLKDAELKAVMLGSEALIQPSLSEGFGLTGLEAMKLGVPLLASHAGAMPEIFGNYATYFDPFDITNMAQTIDKSVGQRPSTLKIAKANIMHQHSWVRMAAKTTVVYQNCL